MAKLISGPEPAKPSVNRGPDEYPMNEGAARPVTGVTTANLDNGHTSIAPQNLDAPVELPNFLFQNNLASVCAQAGPRKPLVAFVKAPRTALAVPRLTTRSQSEARTCNLNSGSK
jgi:hypothetical protein